MLNERDEKLNELTKLKEELDEERNRAAQLQQDLKNSHEMEQSEKERLVGFYPFALYRLKNVMSI